MSACNNFPFRVFVTTICWTSTEVLLNLVAPLDWAVLSLHFEQTNLCWTSGFDSVNIVEYCQQKALWIVFLVFDLGVPSSDLEWSNIWSMALIPLALNSLRLWFAWFQQKALWIVLLTRFKCFFVWLWVNHFVYFVCIWCLFTIWFSLLRLSQILAACSEPWYRKLEFCVTSFLFYYHRLWWNGRVQYWHYFSYKYFGLDI